MQFGQEMALVMQTTHAQPWQYPDRVDKRFVFFHWKCTHVLQKSSSLSIKQTCLKRYMYHHDLLRHLPFTPSFILLPCCALPLMTLCAKKTPSARAWFLHSCTQWGSLTLSLWPYSRGFRGPLECSPCPSTTVRTALVQRRWRHA